jgi:hypothetical protein
MKLRNCVLVLLPVVLIGCGIAEEDHQAVINQLDECKAEQARWEELYQESVEERQQALDEALAMLPAAHDDLRSSIDARLAEVTRELDAAIKAEVEDSFYDLADAIAEGYNLLQQENKQLSTQLAESRSLMETVLEKTGTIEQKVGVEQDTFTAARQTLLLEIGEVEAFLRDWNYKYVDCKGCSERLRINKRERDALAQLMDDVMARLAAVRDRVTAPGGEDAVEDVDAGP